MKLRLLPLAGVAFALLTGAQTAHAATPGLTATGYHITDIPPARDTDTYPTCGTATIANLNVVWEYAPLAQCDTDRFMVHVTGTITMPDTGTAQFWLAADDGGTATIGPATLGTWDDKGCSADLAEPITVTAGDELPVDLWYYENGGATCLMLAWRINGGEWEIVPPSAFTATTPTTTTTTSTSTTTTSTTTTSTTTTTTTTPATTTSAAPETTIYQPTSSSSAPTVTQPTPSSIQNDATTSTTPAATNLATTTIPATIPSTIPTGSTTTTVALPEITPEQALATATDVAAVAALTPEAAAEVFAAIDETTLTPEQGAAIVAAVQRAPNGVRAAFEDAVNVYGGATDEYVPLGSRIPVKARRIVIIVTGILVAMPAPRKARP